MRSGVIAQKLGMTRVYTDAGEHVPVTVLKVENCQVVGVRKSVDGKGYDAVQLGVPIVVGVPYRNIEQWRGFAGDLAEECSIGSSRLHEWLLQHGFDLSRHTGSSAFADDDVNRLK